MTGVLVWKVYREQRWVWLAIAVLAAGAVLLRVTIMERDLPRDTLSTLFGSFAYVYGLVVGAILLAGEREGGTAAFLESLPVRRVSVWWVKCTAGVLLILTQVLFLWYLLLSEVMRDWPWGLWFLLVMLGAALLGFAWGLFFSARMQTAMGAIFAGIGGQLVAVLPLFWLDGLIYVIGTDVQQATPGSLSDEQLLAIRRTVFLVLGLLLIVAPIIASGVFHVWLDQRVPVARQESRAGFSSTPSPVRAAGTESP